MQSVLTWNYDLKSCHNVTTRFNSLVLLLWKRAKKCKLNQVTSVIEIIWNESLAHLIFLIWMEQVMMNIILISMKTKLDYEQTLWDSTYILILSQGNSEELVSAFLCQVLHKMHGLSCCSVITFTNLVRLWLLRWNTITVFIWENRKVTHSSYLSYRNSYGTSR